MKRRALLAAPLALLFGAKAAKAPLEYDFGPFSQGAARAALAKIDAAVRAHRSPHGVTLFVPNERTEYTFSATRMDFG